MTAFILGVSVLVVGTLFTNEMLGWLSRLSRFLVEYAVRQLPESMRHDRREEWLANLEYEEQGGKKLSELIAAFEALLGAYRTARALESMLGKEEQVKLLQLRGTRHLFGGAGISFIGQGLLSFAEAVRPDLYQTTQWAWPLFALSMAIGTLSIIQSRRYYKKAEKIEHLS